MRLRAGRSSGFDHMENVGRVRLWASTAGYLLKDKRVALPLDRNPGLLHVTRKDDGVVGQLEQSVDDAAHLLIVVAAR